MQNERQSDRLQGRASAIEYQGSPKERATTSSTGTFPHFIRAWLWASIITDGIEKRDAATLRNAFRLAIARRRRWHNAGGLRHLALITTSSPAGAARETLPTHLQVMIEFHARRRDMPSLASSLDRACGSVDVVIETGERYICPHIVCQKERERPHRQNTKSRSHVSPTRRSNLHSLTRLLLQLLNRKPPKKKYDYTIITFSKSHLRTAAHTCSTNQKGHRHARDRHKSKTPIRGAREHVNHFSLR